MKKNGARCKLHLAIYGELLYDMKAVKNGMTFGDIAQLVERCVRNAEVRGSSPLISTRKQKAARRAVFCLLLPDFPAFSRLLLAMFYAKLAPY